VIISYPTTLKSLQKFTDPGLFFEWHVKSKFFRAGTITRSPGPVPGFDFLQAALPSLSKYFFLSVNQVTDSGFSNLFHLHHRVHPLVAGKSLSARIDFPQMSKRGRDRRLRLSLKYG